jgi:hypothetical protein
MAISKVRENDDVHYSDAFMEELETRGWEKVDPLNFTKIFIGKATSGGVLNPKGKVEVHLEFDIKYRFIIVYIGWADCDFDGRNYIGDAEDLVSDIEKEISNYLKCKFNKFIIRDEV